MVRTKIITLAALMALALVITGCDKFWTDLIDEALGDECTNQNATQGNCNASIWGVWNGKTGPIVIEEISFPTSLITGETWTVNSVPLRFDLEQLDSIDLGPDLLMGTVEVTAVGKHIVQVSGEVDGVNVYMRGTLKPFEDTPTYNISMSGVVSKDGRTMLGVWEAYEGDAKVKEGSWNANRQ